jgi:hypothetical protein
MLLIVGSLFAAMHKNNNCTLKERLAYPRLQNLVPSIGTAQASISASQTYV